MLVLINDWKVEAMEQVETVLSIFTSLVILIIIHLVILVILTIIILAIIILVIIIHIVITADQMEVALSILPAAGFSFIIVIVIFVIIIVIMIILRWRQPYQYCLLLDFPSSLPGSPPKVCFELVLQSSICQYVAKLLAKVLSTF